MKTTIITRTERIPVTTLVEKQVFDKITVDLTKEEAIILRTIVGDSCYFKRLFDSLNSVRVPRIECKADINVSIPLRYVERAKEVAEKWNPVDSDR